MKKPDLKLLHCHFPCGPDVYWFWIICSLTVSESWVTRLLQERQWRQQESPLFLEVMGWSRWHIHAACFLTDLLYKPTGIVIDLIKFWTCFWSFLLIEVKKTGKRWTWAPLFLHSLFFWKCQTTEEAIRLAHDIGFPVMIKVGPYLWSITLSIQSLFLNDWRYSLFWATGEVKK